MAIECNGDNKISLADIVIEVNQNGSDITTLQGASSIPTESAHSNETLSNKGVDGDTYWSPLVYNPQAITEDIIMNAGGHASIVSPTISDGVTITIPDGSILVIL